MKNCNNCGHHFTVQDKFKMTWRPNFNHKIYCPNCGKTYYFSSKRMGLTYGLLLMLEFFLMLTANLFDYGMAEFFIVLLLILGLIVFLMPLTMKMVEEPDGLLDRQFREMEKNTKK
ncbi:TIGR04104 family putative zinc finger protein [Macrococcus carouselicus]|uniref:Cxxc_20_cxxc protein n=1 Tax=Macrococcus carouselicus TaxID=69969 RepID=A0A9Q8CQB0_9STAP|nr:TIGR04104 family putative zinc finger protein [Macrococcus carouselicus]TDM04617.1 hypothetical protein ERX40_05445 [Macrococcus carouselicus]